MSARLLAGVFLLVSAESWAQTDPLVACEPMYDGVGAPVYQNADAMAEDETRLLCRDGYLLSHNNRTKVPDWVLERLTPARFRGSAVRKNNFAHDEDLVAGQRSELPDYDGSGFDRGHQAPAADMKFDQAAMDESFLLSNMAPQVGIGFNRHIWAHLEDEVRVWAERRGDLVVITGPIYGSHKPIGDEKVAVPDKFYKIAYEPARNRAIALVLPNKKIKGNDLEPFVTSVDEIEEETGIDFFPEVRKSKQRSMERNVGTLWEH
jgi:endonuclease G, mitochondrial